MQSSAADVPLLVKSANSSSERRVSPSWTIAQFKARLEPITGIPASAQRLSLRAGSRDVVSIHAPDEDAVLLASFSLQAYAEVHVEDTRPPGARDDFTNVDSVDKYVMPAEEYESRKDSVLAWKKAQKLGRFDPEAPAQEEEKVRAMEEEIERRGLSTNARVRLLPESDARLGRIAFMGPVPHLPGPLPNRAPWIGVALDEPTGKNDGSVEGTRYFDAGGKNRGVFVRAERVEVGDFEADDFEGLDGDDDMEEI